MKKRIYVVITVLLAAFIALLAHQTGLFTFEDLKDLRSGVPVTADRETSGAGAADTAREELPNWAETTAGEDTELDLDDIRLVLGNVDAGQKTSLLADENAFRDFVQQEAAKLALLKAARANNIDQDPNTQFLMQRSADNVVREVYANQIIASKVPADFPTEAQMRQYYDENKSDFVIEQRIPVWQIFLPVGSAMGDKQIEEIETRARAISHDLQGDKVDFATAAFQNSAHQASAVNGGYMGLLKVSELIPGINEPLMALEEGEVSEPVKSQMGFHIFKRGAVVPEQEISYAQVRGQINNLLLSQVHNKLRNEIIDYSRANYPVPVENGTVEEWLRALREEQAAATTP